jgi:hypothetical protein
LEINLTTDFKDPTAIPYFLWDHPMSLAVFRQQLKEASTPERLRLLGLLLREAKDTDIWLFTTPQQVWDSWALLSRFMGRRKAFWEFLFSQWRSMGLIT